MTQVLDRETRRASLAHSHETLDPSDWDGFRTQAHRMLDDMLDYTEHIRVRPVWQPIPDEVRARFRGGLPRQPADLFTVHEEFMSDILPFAAGNVHPCFMGWVHGGGTPVGMLAEMLAAGLNANLGGRDQAPIEVERQLVQWTREIFGFPEGASGLFVTGTSMANLIAVVIARDLAFGFDLALDLKVRRGGVSADTRRLTAYASTAVHGCIGKAMDLSGLGSDALRRIPTDAHHRIGLTELTCAIERDRDTGFTPFLVVGSAGTVDTGAIDDLSAIADLCEREKIWFHVDGAYGALGMLARDIAPRLKGIERADSLAFDFHKWGQVPYDAGFVLVRDGELHHKAFSNPAAYLQRLQRGLAAGSPWPCDFGPDLSRSFRALKTWFTLKVHGADALGASISRTCELARYLESRIAATPELELLAPVELNIVCFRYRSPDVAESDRINEEIVAELQESGIAVPSTTTIGGRLAIRAAIVNHRTSRMEVDALVDATLSFGRAILNRRSGPELSARTDLQSQLNAVELQLAHCVPSDADRPAKEGLAQALSCVENQKYLTLLFLKGNLLEQMGRPAEARRSYASLLALDPDHVGALNNLGNLLFVSGERARAQQLYATAVSKHADNLMSRVNLANALIQAGEFAEAREHCEHALTVDPCFQQAHAGLSFVFADQGDAAQAAFHRRAAFEDRCIIKKKYCGDQPPITVLELIPGCGGGTRIDIFLSDRIFQRYLVVADFYHPGMALPPHQLVINAIGDVDVAAEALAGAQSLLQHTKAPVINRPSAVLGTSRCDITRRLAGVPGIVTPKTITLSRKLLAAPDAQSTLALHGLGFPLLLRTPGFHGGEHFVKVETPSDLPSELEKLPGRDLTAIQYLDAHRSDGKARKYRAMMIDGRLYPLHAAIASQWKIHYFSAEMADYPEHRAEEASFLENMPAVLGPLAMTALTEIEKTLGLDYGGIDFGLNERGEVLLFEANATMAVVSPDADPRWDYRRPAIERIWKAVGKMLLDRTRNRRPMNTDKHG
jgi:aromatic-L-amino-acid decarboxylase